MDNLYDLIIKVTSFPDIYIGKPSLERLHAFIGGYLYQNKIANDHCLDGFNEFVSKRYNISTDHSWSSIICFFSYNDEEAFSTFIKLFNEYVQKTDELE